MSFLKKLLLYSTLQLHVMEPITYQVTLTCCVTITCLGAITYHSASQIKKLKTQICVLYIKVEICYIVFTKDKHRYYIYLIKSINNNYNWLSIWI